MNYQRIYNQIIERAQHRKLEGYKEKHHILPRCLGGTNDKENIAELTAREHFLCHMLLIEIYPKNFKLIHTVFMMSTVKKRKEFQYNVFVSSRTYEYLKLRKQQELGLIINEKYISAFHKIYPQIILNDNNKNCINYSFNKNIELKNIICLCGNNIKRFRNYTKGYQNYCSRKCCNNFTKEKSNITKENKGLWDNSKKRIRQQEIKFLGIENIEKLRRERISNSNKGKTAGGYSRGKYIIQYDLEGNFIKEWPSIRQAGQKLANTNGETIRKCLKGLQKTAYDFKWKYKT